MKKIIMLTLTMLISLTSYACDVNDEEKVAKAFIGSYYSQYELRDEMESLKGSISPGEIGSFISNHFNGLMTEKCIASTAANRILPKFDVLESDIIMAKPKDYSFTDAENEIEGTLRFNAKVSYTHKDGSHSEKEAEGLIRIVNESGSYLVDGFILIQD